ATGSIDAMVTRLSGFAVRRPVIVIIIWLATLVAGFGVGTGVFERLVTDVGTVPGSESSHADARLDAASPEPDSITAIISGRPVADLQGGVSAAITEVRAIPG